MSEKAKKVFVRAVAIVLAAIMVGGCATVLFSMLSAL